MRLSVLPFALLASRVVADGAAILSCISQITATTLSLNSTVASWDGGLLGTIPILAVSTSLLIDINNGTSTAKTSANLTLVETVQVAQATIALVTDVQSTLTTIVDTKPKFDKLLIVSPVILLNLLLEKDATDAFSDAVLAKVPAAFAALAASIIAPIDTAFSNAIAAYE